jgi:hypothetical protein
MRLLYERVAVEFWEGVVGNDPGSRAPTRDEDSRIVNA